jgi:hypothetical protein
MRSAPHTHRGESWGVVYGCLIKGCSSAFNVSMVNDNDCVPSGSSLQDKGRIPYFSLVSMVVTNRWTCRCADEKRVLYDLR